MTNETDIKVSFDFELDGYLLSEINKIAKQQEWQIEDAIRLLAGHALGIYQEGGYDRADMELIIKGAPNGLPSATAIE